MSLIFNTEEAGFLEVGNEVFEIDSGTYKLVIYDKCVESELNFLKHLKNKLLENGFEVEPVYHDLVWIKTLDTKENPLFYDGEDRYDELVERANLNFKLIIDPLISSDEERFELVSKIVLASIQK